MTLRQPFQRAQKFIRQSKIRFDWNEDRFTRAKRIRDRNGLPVGGRPVCCQGPTETAHQTQLRRVERIQAFTYRRRTRSGWGNDECTRQRHIRSVRGSKKEVYPSTEARMVQSSNIQLSICQRKPEIRSANDQRIHPPMPNLVGFYGVGKHNSTRVDETRKCWIILAIKTKARTVMGRGEKSLLSDPGPEVRVGREKEKANVRR